MNTTGTNASNCAETVPSAAMPDLTATKTHLVRLRRARGFNTPVGHRCSNILEMLDGLPPESIDYLTPRSTTDRRANLLRSIKQQAAELDAELGKLPFMLIVGERERDAGTASVRSHEQGDLGAVVVDEIPPLITGA